MKVEMYTKAACPYCGHAKSLLRQYGVEVIEHDVTHDAGKVSEMVDRSLGRWTVPQIFFNGVPMGGCDDLHTLHYAGQLEDLLNDGYASCA
ncbi:glutaredoxin 3 [Chromatiales bacterium (ex Bugula neritina AB1)]|nr:glutaredoxin 3 [Chromatiales bacterium (ex Bugula neritina AB1)]